MSTTLRIECPHCSALCLAAEKNCWQCHKLLHSPPAPEETATKGFNDQDIKPGLIRFGEDPEPEPAPTYQAPEPSPEPTTPGKRMRMTMSGEMVEEDVPIETPSATGKLVETIVAGKIGNTEIVAELGPELMVLAFCKQCGHTNPEDLRECEKCGTKLDIVAAGSVGDIVPLKRAWSYDVLGACWIILGMAAVFAGQFLIKQDFSSKRMSLPDYLWTGFVVLAPGALIFMRHYIVKPLFWVMTVASSLIWLVIGILWWYGQLMVSDNMQITLIWFAILTGLSLLSWFIVRVNDAFDMTF